MRARTCAIREVCASDGVPGPYGVRRVQMRVRELRICPARLCARPAHMMRQAHAERRLFLLWRCDAPHAATRRPA